MFHGDQRELTAYLRDENNRLVVEPGAGEHHYRSANIP